MTPDKITTLIGLVVGAVQASRVDWGKLAHGDGHAVGVLAQAVGLGLWGFFTNKK